MRGDREFYPKLKIKSVHTLLAALRRPGPIRDVVQDESGRYLVSFDLFPVRGGAVREAIASGAIVETYPGKNAPFWRVPEFVEKPRRPQYDDLDDLLRRRLDSLSDEERREVQAAYARLKALLTAS